MAKPKHRIEIEFTATERGFAVAATPERWEFDSESVHITSLDYYLEGHVGCEFAHVYYSNLVRPGVWTDPRQSLRVLWWEYQYQDGSWWIAGAVLNEAIEGTLGRFKGNLKVTVQKPAERPSEGHPGTMPKEEASEGIVTLLDQRSASFSFGAPQAFPHLAKIQYYVRNSIPEGTIPPESLYAPQAAPRRNGGEKTWKPDWSPRDRTGDPRYQGDSRNPNIDKMLAGLPVPRWYEAQTHAHGLESFRSKHETGWLAAKKAGNQTLEKTILRSLWEEVSSDYGSFSPSLGAEYWIDGRPGFLSFLDGSLPRAGIRYRLTEVDSAALKPFVLTEGRPQISKGGLYQFTECFGREKLSYLERVSDKYAGQYIGANAWDLEHGGQEDGVAAALILADPLAKRQLHHRAEEVLSNGRMVHSTRSTPAGWNMLPLLYGYLVFIGNSVFGIDADRYIETASDWAEWTWDHRFDTTPYQGVLTVNYEKLVLDQPEENVLGWEASMQIACALHAATVGYRIESDNFHKQLYAELIQYYGDVLAQDYVIDPSYGGILARWSLQFKADLQSTVPVSEQLKLSGGSYAFRNWDGAEGWCGPALAAAARIVPELMPLAQQIYDHQKTKLVSGRPMLSPNHEEGWSMYAESIITFGWPGQ